MPAVVQFLVLEPTAVARSCRRAVWGYAIVLATLSTVLPVFLQAEALRRIGANHFALIGAVGPVSVAITSALGLDEPFTLGAGRGRRAGDLRRASRHTQERLTMDLGIRGKTALVCAASKGLGKGCAVCARPRRREPRDHRARRGSAGGDGGGNSKARRKGHRGGRATSLPPEGRAAALKACPSPDILVNNAGGPPPGDFREWEREAWVKALDANMITPILLISAVVDGMIARKFGRIVNITSAAVKAPIPELGLSNGARTGLTGFVAGLSRTDRAPQRHHQQPAARARSRPTGCAPTWNSTRRRPARPRPSCARCAPTPIPSGRFGTIEEFGDACAFLCSAQAGFITGQNLLMDGGAYPGTF